MFRHHGEGPTEHARSGVNSKEEKRTQRSPSKSRVRRLARSENGKVTRGRKRQQRVHRSETPSAKREEEEGHEGQDKVTERKNKSHVMFGWWEG